jgi:hypothetical protein
MIIMMKLERCGRKWLWHVVRNWPDVLRETTINLSHGNLSPQLRLELYTFLIQVRSNYWYIWSKLLSKWVSQQSYCLLVEHQFVVLWHSLHACLCSLVLHNKPAYFSQERKWALILLSHVWVMEHGVGIHRARKFEQNVETRYSDSILLSSTSYCLLLFNWIYSEGLIKKQLEHEVNWNKLSDDWTFVEILLCRMYIK